jgi:hypothetical protein
MSEARLEPATLAGEPNDPPPQQEPTHDVPVYPEHDPPPGQESAVRAAAQGGGKKAPGREDDQPVQGSEPGEGREDVDEDDLDPKVPHSPPDAGKQNVLFDENMMAG